MPKQSQPQKDEPRPDVTEESVAGLEAQLAALRSQAAELSAKVEAAKPEAPRESTPLPTDRPASETTDEEVARAEVLRDPFDSRDALKILRDPPGRKLRWISVAYRDTRNLRGWQPVRYDDAIGREIDRYIGAPPERMLGTSKLDEVVRRGDVVLCWIDIGIWRARQAARERKAKFRLQGQTSDVQTPYGDHGVSYGKGLERDTSPYSEVRKAPGFIAPDPREYRKRTKGTVKDPVMRTEGQNFFEEAPGEE